MKGLVLRPGSHCVSEPLFRLSHAVAAKLAQLYKQAHASLEMATLCRGPDREGQGVAPHSSPCLFRCRDHAQAGAGAGNRTITALRQTQEIARVCIITLG